MYAHHFEESSSITCSQTLQQYKDFDHGRPSADLSLVIAHHADCILSNTTETIKANMASASVLLELMPSFLSFVGPSLVESSTLALKRPILSMLLAVAAPPFQSFQPLDHHNALKAFKHPFKLPPQITLSCPTHVLISVLQYLLTLATAIDVVAVSLQVGRNTIVTWKKVQSFLPLIWVMLSLAIHIGAMIRHHLFLTSLCLFNYSPEYSLPQPAETSRNQVQSPTAARENGPFVFSLPRPNSVPRGRDASSCLTTRQSCHV